jgi:hypothetical protein
MSRLSILHLPDPADAYRADQAYPCINTGQSFERLPRARAEDGIRVQMMRGACRAANVPFDREEAHHLADRLQQSALGTAEPLTMASSVYMGRMRLRIGGALWEWAEGRSDVSTFTLIRRGLIFAPAELAHFEPALLINSTRSALYRCGAQGAEGQLFASIHGEFNPLTCCFHVHLHGVASGEMTTAVNRLRELPNYRRGKASGDRQPRVVISREPLNNLPYPLLYTLQAFWPCRWRGLIEGIVRHGKRQRIPEPFHTMLLLWLDRWSLQDITLMMGMSVGRDGITPNNSYTNRRGA